jgi:hypothetical protein
MDQFGLVKLFDRFSHGAVINVITDADRGLYTCMGDTLDIKDGGLVIPRLRGGSTENFAFLQIKDLLEGYYLDR